MFARYLYCTVYTRGSAWMAFDYNYDFRKFCSNSNYKYEEIGESCNRNIWYKSKKLSPPILDGPDYHRCGPDVENAICSTNPVSYWNCLNVFDVIIKMDWTVREPYNGPCCSPNGYCGITDAHCNCKYGCVDFRYMPQSKLKVIGICYRNNVLIHITE